MEDYNDNTFNELIEQFNMKYGKKNNNILIKNNQINNQNNNQNNSEEKVFELESIYDNNKIENLNNSENINIDIKTDNMKYSSNYNNDDSNSSWMEEFNYLFKISSLSCNKYEMQINKKLGKIVYYNNGKTEIAYHSKISPKIIYNNKIYKNNADWINTCFNKKI